MDEDKSRPPNGAELRWRIKELEHGQRSHDNDLRIVATSIEANSRLAAVHEAEQDSRLSALEKANDKRDKAITTLTAALVTFALTVAGSAIAVSLAMADKF